MTVISMADIRRLDLNLLRTLDALLETRSVTRAATQLGLTQPAVSGMLVRLREAFDDPLFVRAQRGILPTPRAEALMLPLKATLREIEGLIQPVAFDPVEAKLTVSIAATDYAQRVVLLPFLAALREKAPSIRVSVRPVDGPALAARMERGTLDLALITPDTAAETLRSRRLFDERYVWVMRAGHPAASRPLDLDTFCAVDHAIMSHDGTQFRGATDEVLDAAGRTRRVVASVPSFTTLVDLVRRSDCCSVLPYRLVRDEPGLVVIEPPLAVPGFTKVLVWHERTQADPAMRWIRRQLAAVQV